MGLFDFLRQPPQVQGRIGYFGLQDWWLSAFSDKERQYIQATHQPLGESGDLLTTGAIGYSGQTPVGLLWCLAGWFTKEQDRSIAYRILDKAEELASSGAPVLDRHFLYGQEINIHYKDRDQQEHMDKAIWACRQQIALAPEVANAFKDEYEDSPLPAHKGYEQLAIILEKQGSLQEAIELAAQARAEGWSGDWARRIERCEEKAAKA